MIRFRSVVGFVALSRQITWSVGPTLRSRLKSQACVTSAGLTDKLAGLFLTLNADLLAGLQAGIQDFGPGRRRAAEAS